MTRERLMRKYSTRHGLMDLVEVMVHHGADEEELRTMELQDLVELHMHQLLDEDAERLRRRSEATR